MGRWKITDPTTGDSMVVSGDYPPDQNDIAELFSKSQGKHPEAEFRQGEPEGLLSRVGGAAKEAIFGSPERADAEGTGVSQQPTMAKMVETGVTGASAAYAGAAPFNPAILRALGLGLVGTALGGKAGQYVGSGLEAAGAPSGTKHVAGTIGGLVGGFAAPFKGAEALRSVLKMMPHSGMTGVAKMMLGDVAAPAAAQAATVVADPLVGAAKALTKRGTFANAESALAWLNGLAPEIQGSIVRQLGGTEAAVAAKAAPMAATAPAGRLTIPTKSPVTSHLPAEPPMPEAAVTPQQAPPGRLPIPTESPVTSHIPTESAPSPELQSIINDIPGPTLPAPPAPGTIPKGQSTLPTYFGDRDPTTGARLKPRSRSYVKRTAPTGMDSPQEMADSEMYFRALLEKGKSPSEAMKIMRDLMRSLEGQ